jgi:hypothetical protein
MTQDEIIEMAEQAGFDCYGKHITWDDVICTDELKAFTKLVAAKEREACAKVCDSFYESWINIHGRYEFMGEGAQECAEAIRAREQA